ncbi:flagellar hook-associated protein 2 [Cytobacillus gottheilii]|uniref:flagellar hook-associated protein 2 n=1 Tax=Cytobacillus gottheilii TaxID=859144 RepID=UPI0009BAA510|nr:flagellar hook-associated protein 2 [Cytobacillus gottheilii]
MVNSIRFSGIASGMDTQSIVDSMMKAQRIPLDKIHQKKQLLEWKRDDYRNVNLMLKELDDFTFNGIFRQANLLKKSVSSSNTEFVTANASPNAANVNYTIKDVKLATAARQQGQNISSSKLDPDKSLRSQQNIFSSTSSIDWQEETKTETLKVPEGSNGEFQLSKKEISITAGANISVGGQDFTVRTDAITDGNPLKENEVYVNQTTGKVKFGAELAAGTTFDVSYTNHYLEFDIKTYNEQGEAQYKNFKFDGSTSLNNMFNTINKSTAGVNMFYDSSSDQVSAMRTETGEFNKNGNEIEFLNVIKDSNGDPTRSSSSFFNNVLGLGNDIAGTGTDAEFSINGLNTTRKSNTFTLDGVTFTLKKDSVVNGVSTGESATINIQSDTDSIMTTIKDFVNKYNEIIGKVNGELTEERYRDYSPLTDEEKEALSEKEVEKWEDQARSGMLRRDSILSGALDQMRNNMYSEVTVSDSNGMNSNYNQLAEIGITTTRNYLDRGKLEIDEEKLKAAIEDDPEAVYQLFMADGNTSSEKGLARRLRDSISSTIQTVEQRAGNSYKTPQSYTMGKQLLDYEEQIDRFETKLVTIEDRYWKQFNAMEKAMQNLNNQSNQLLSYLGMGNQ